MDVVNFRGLNFCSCIAYNCSAFYFIWWVWNRWCPIDMDWALIIFIRLYV